MFSLIKTPRSRETKTPNNLDQLQKINSRLKQYITGAKGMSPTMYKQFLATKIDTIRNELQDLLNILKQEQTLYKIQIEEKQAMIIVDEMFSVMNSGMTLIEYCPLEKGIELFLQILYFAIKHPIFKLFQSRIKLKIIENNSLLKINPIDYQQNLQNNSNNQTRSKSDISNKSTFKSKETKEKLKELKINSKETTQITFSERFMIYCNYKEKCIQIFEYINRFVQNKSQLVKTNKTIKKCIGNIIGRLSLQLDSLYNEIEKLFEMNTFEGESIKECLMNVFIDNTVDEENKKNIPIDNLSIEMIIQQYDANDLITTIGKGFIDGFDEQERLKQPFLKSREYKAILSKYYNCQQQVIRQQKGMSMNSFLTSFDNSTLQQTLTVLTTNTNFMSRKCVSKMTRLIEKYILKLTKDKTVFTPIEIFPFEHKLLIDAIHIARISDNVYALTKMLNMIYYTIHLFPNGPRSDIIHYLISDSFHFFFTHWSEILRKHYHHFIVYRSTHGTVRHVFNDKLSQDEKKIYEMRKTENFNPFEEDKNTITRVRDASRMLELTKSHFSLSEKLKIELSTQEFRQLSKDAGDWFAKKKFYEVPVLEFYFDRYDSLE